MTVSLGLPPQSLSIHLMSAVEGVDLNDGLSLGFHYLVNVGTAANPIIQPFLQAGYFSVNSAAVQGNFNGSGTAVLGHEIAEWLNDPAIDNNVPAWQDPAFPHICDNPFLEVGDPLEAVSRGFGVSLNGRTYQFPEVAFLPWFAGEHHSTSVNGWYSSLNTFSSPSAACPVFTNFGFVGVDFTGAASSVLTGVNNSVNNKMKIVAYAGTPPSLTGIVMDFSFDPATGGMSIANLQQVYFPGSLLTVPPRLMTPARSSACTSITSGINMVSSSAKASTPPSISPELPPPRFWPSTTGRCPPSREITWTPGVEFMGLFRLAASSFQ